jgi:hypothetical protein
MNNMNTMHALFGDGDEVHCSININSIPRNHILDCELVSLSNLKTFLVDSPEKKDLRFIVGTDGILWFAPEGIPSINVPAHFQMTGSSFYNAKCLTAGNFSFKPKNDQYILTIINKSGDFKPNIQSLKWVIAILAVNLETSPDLLNINDDVVIKESPSGHELLKINIKSEETMVWVNQVFSNSKKEVFRNQPVDNKKISYSNETHHSGMAASRAKRIKLMFPCHDSESNALLEQDIELAGGVKRKSSLLSMFNLAAHPTFLSLTDKENISEVNPIDAKGAPITNVANEKLNFLTWI